MLNSLPTDLYNRPNCSNLKSWLEMQKQCYWDKFKVMCQMQHYQDEAPCCRERSPICILVLCYLNHKKSFPSDFEGRIDQLPWLHSALSLRPGSMIVLNISQGCFRPWRKYSAPWVTPSHVSWQLYQAKYLSERYDCNWCIVVIDA